MNQMNRDTCNLKVQYGFDDFKQIGADSLEMGYQYKRCGGSNKRMLNFPRRILSENNDQITEFDQVQQLYYYLAWTCKMQLVDGEFVEYTLNNGEYIAIFNGEIHEKDTNDLLYAVSVLNDEHNKSHRNKAKWKLTEFMTAMEIYNIYGIDLYDLPMGSRYKHSYFQYEMNDYNHSLYGNFYVDRDWYNTKIIHSKQYKQYYPDFSAIDINKLIKESINNICSDSNNISLIPILNIDKEKGKIQCVPLIPIKIPSYTYGPDQEASEWIAVSYKIKSNRMMITGLYIDTNDIINRASLVDPNAFFTYQWLNGQEDEFEDDFITDCSSQLSPVSNYSDDSNDRYDYSANNSPRNSQTDDLYNDDQQSQHDEHGGQDALFAFKSIIYSLQQQLNESLKRERMLISMLQQKDKQLQCQHIIDYSTNNDAEINNNLYIENGDFCTLTSLIDSLQKQLNESLKRERMLVNMLQQKDQQLMLQNIIGGTIPIIPTISNTPISTNNMINNPLLISSLCLNIPPPLNVLQNIISKTNKI